MGPSKPDTSYDPFASSIQAEKNEVRTLQTQLQFNRNVPAAPENLAVRFSSPRPIIIEKLKPPDGQRDLDNGDDANLRSSVTFSVISEEKLKLAIQLAKRDVKRRHLEEQVKEAENKSVFPQISEQCKSEVSENPAERSASKSRTCLKYHQQLGQPSKMEIINSGAKVYLYTPNQGKLKPPVSDSPPTHDPGPGPKPRLKKIEDKSTQEVRRLQKELRCCIQKIEELVKKERCEEILDPDEERRVRIRRQEQAARSARMLYVLQQQVKEIQEDLEKLSPHKIKHTKKSRAMSRVAAAHRGAIRALQVFATQFTDQSEQQVPAHYKELGNLIRQLSLCSAKLEMDSSVPDIIIDILLQIEGKSPVSSEMVPAREQIASSKKEKKPPISKERLGQEQKKPSVARKLLTDEDQHVANIPLAQKLSSHADLSDQEFQQEHDSHTSDRDAVLKTSQDALMRAGAVKKVPVLESGPLKKKGVLLPAKQGIRKLPRSRPVQPQAKHARFQETTVAFRLKESKPLVKESRITWVPPNPTSPPASPKRAPWGYMNASPKASRREQSALQKEGTEEGRLGAIEKEALRLAWLDAETSRRMKELTEFSREEMEKIQKLRSEGASPTQLADKVEKAVREHLEPLLDKAQKVSLSLETNTRLKESSFINKLSSQAAEKAASHADMLSEKLLDDLLEDTAQELWNMEQHKKMQAEAVAMHDSPSLETMLQRMEEIERYQDAVRRRFNQIVYADSEFWAQEEKRERESASIEKRPMSPHPLQITKLIGHKESQVDIVFERPFDGNAIEEDGEVEEKLETGNDIWQPLTRNISQQKEHCIFLSVPKHMLQNILDYNNRYEQHLKLISHEAVGHFNPWHIAESLAEELTEEALCDVAAELQDVCEDYAEAVFTSEFLQPTE
ncbi:protein moonraker isoform X7 [Dermochelys coriacea]|uniref:protein moonraker isoform X7 n=1 Tax=Dermochelys coriacea TaxID=27794 RepID=UPI0018E74F2A|nr:protein moonraker isoform X7 [Dermochelys coriacea]XP_043355187.1 protein moonraker isoform X7 [Dermochelys coriacea]XP_043355188.1 protein moonraker isoform X7 [Dermochelys coriacea]XP_043355189.1 protein moonraker isoform X7 [Dermochelys coriacea]